MPLAQNNRLSFISQTPSTAHGSRALYQCECGKTIDTYIYRVNNGTVASCGCLRREINRQRHEEAISGDEESRLARLRRESLKKAKKARMKEVYAPLDARLPTEDGRYEDWIRNEFARLSLSGRKARIVWIDDRIGLWAQTSDLGQTA